MVFKRVTGKNDCSQKILSMAKETKMIAAQNCRLEMMRSGHVLLERMLVELAGPSQH